MKIRKHRVSLLSISRTRNEARLLDQTKATLQKKAKINPIFHEHRWHWLYLQSFHQAARLKACRLMLQLVYHRRIYAKSSLQKQDQYRCTNEWNGYCCFIHAANCFVFSQGHTITELIHHEITIAFPDEFYLSRCTEAFTFNVEPAAGSNQVRAWSVIVLAAMAEAWGAGWMQ